MPKAGQPWANPPCRTSQRWWGQTHLLNSDPGRELSLAMKDHSSRRKNVEALTKQFQLHIHSLMLPNKRVVEKCHTHISEHKIHLESLPTEAVDTQDNLLRPLSAQFSLGLARMALKLEIAHLFPTCAALWGAVGAWI